MNYYKLVLVTKLGREFVSNKIQATGLSDTEHQICSFLYFHKGISQDTIAEALIIDKTTVAKALTNLENKKLIIKKQNKENKRKNVISLSDSGEMVMSENANLHNQWFEEVISSMTNEEKNMFSHLFEKLLENALDMRVKDNVEEKGKAINGK